MVPSSNGPRDGRVATADAMGTVRDGYAAVHGDPLARSEAPRRRVRWRVSWRAAAAGALALALVGGAVAVRAASVRAGDAVTLPVPAPEGTPASMSTVAPVVGATAGASAGPADGATPVPQTVGGQPPVVVHVIGAVRHEGLERMPPGSRVADAIDAAGGATSSAALDAVNLARVLVDGEQVVVPRKGESAQGAGSDEPGAASSTPGAPPATTAGSGAGTAAVVDLNTADAATLDGLPGVGPVLAGRIVDYRGEHPFTSIDQLEDVPGIGPATMTRLRDLVRV